MSAEDNIIQIVFRAVLDQLAGDMANAKEEVKEAVDDIKASTESVNTSTANTAKATKENMGNVSAAMEGAAKSVRNFKQEMDDLRTVENAVNGTVKSLEELNAVEQAMDRLMQKGMLDAELQAEAFTALGAAETKLAAQALAAEAAEAKLANTHGTSSAAARELGVMVGEALRGNYSRLEGSSITLANRTGLLSAAFSAGGLVITGLVATVGALIAGYIAGEEEEHKFNQAIESTGNYAGTTTGQMRELTAQVAGGSVTMGDAREAILAMVSSGKLNNEQLQLGAQAAADFSRVTGESMSKAAESIIRLSEDPARAVVKLNEQYHFLTEAEYEHIARLQDEQGASAAATAAIQDLASASAQRAQTMAQDAGTVQRAWNSVKQTLSEVKEAIMDIGRTDSYAQQIATLGAQLDKLNQMKARGQNQTWDLDGLHNVDDQIKAIENQIGVLNTLKMGEDNLAAATANYNRIQEAGTAAAEETRKRIANLKDETAYQERLNEITQRYAAIRAANPTSPLLKGVKFDDSGKPTGGGAFQEEVDKARKDTTPAPDRAAHKLFMQEKRDELTSIQIERDATKAASEERLAEDQKVVDKALALYGKDSTQYRQALRQKENDQLAYDQKLQQLNNAQAEGKRALLELELREEQQQAQALYRTHQISAQNLLDIENNLTERRLAADRAYYQAKEQAAQAAGDDVSAARAQQAIVVAQRVAQATMARNQTEFLINSTNDWMQYTSKVTHLFGGMAQGMIFQGQSLRQAFISSLGQMLQAAIQTFEKMLSRFIAVKLAEVQAHVAGNAIKTASDEQAATESVSINAGAAIKKIIANAAEVFTSVYKAIAGIPYVGPFLAPVMAVAAGAAVIGMVGKVASAERGWERVPYDGAMTELHKDEQVLPAEYAEGLRKLVANGGGGDHYHFTVTAMDSRDVKRFFDQHAHTITRSLVKGAGNNFRPNS